MQIITIINGFNSSHNVRNKCLRCNSGQQVLHSFKYTFLKFGIQKLHEVHSIMFSMQREIVFVCMKWF